MGLGIGSIRIFEEVWGQTLILESGLETSCDGVSGCLCLPCKRAIPIEAGVCKILVPKLVFWVWAVKDYLNLVHTNLVLFCICSLILF